MSKNQNKQKTNLIRIDLEVIKSALKTQINIIENMNKSIMEKLSNIDTLLGLIDLDEGTNGED